jgi:hypothetical protein
LVASQEHRLLLGEMAGEDGFEASFEETCRLIDSLVEVQAATASHAGGLLAAGVPDARWPKLLRELRELVERRAPDDRDLRSLLDSADDRVAAIEECGLPMVLVHGDAHGGNARIGVDQPIWFDWGDSRIGHPLLDDRIIESPQYPDRTPALLDHWLTAWRQAVPASDPRRALHLIRPLAALRLGWVYQMFLDNIEPSERAYHAKDVEPALRRAASIVRGELPL